MDLTTGGLDTTRHIYIYIYIYIYTGRATRLEPDSDVLMFSQYHTIARVFQG
jgi:hypothetical protein